jgi:hypothetical protein
MKPVFSLEPKYTTTMFTREEWSRGPGTPEVKGLVLFSDGSRNEGNGDGCLLTICRQKARLSRETC